MMEIGKKIAQLREQKGWTKYKLSKVSGIDQSTLGRFESGENIPGSDKLLKIAAALGVSMAAFDDNNVEIIPMSHAQYGIERAKEWVSGEPMEAALKKFETASPEGQEKRWREAVEQLKSLSPEEREAIAVIIRNLAASRK